MVRPLLYGRVGDWLRIRVRFLAALAVLTLLAGLPLFQFKEDNAPSERSFIVAVSQPARLRPNTFHFPGWTLYVDDVETPTSHTNQQRLMDFSPQTGPHDVRLEFHDTPMRTWSTPGASEGAT